jgi:hypothetical protein
LPPRIDLPISRRLRKELFPCKYLERRATKGWCVDVVVIAGSGRACRRGHGGLDTGARLRHRVCEARAPLSKQKAQRAFHRLWFFPYASCVKPQTHGGGGAHRTHEHSHHTSRARALTPYVTRFHTIERSRNHAGAHRTRRAHKWRAGERLRAGPRGRRVAS